jgi:two-component system NtrC family sensor kinase
MESLFWQLANRTAETQFIFSLFHLLLAGLTLLVWLHQLRMARAGSSPEPTWLLPAGFALLVLQFGLATFQFGIEFFFRKGLEWRGLERFSRGLMVCGLLLVIAALWQDRQAREGFLDRRLQRACSLVAGLVLLDFVLSHFRVPRGESIRSVPLALIDLLAFIAIGFGMRAVLRAKSGGWRSTLIALGFMGIFLLLHHAAALVSDKTGILFWNAEQHALSVALFAFAWAAGEYSLNLLDRIFVRLNLTFIILASLIMLMTAGMEKYQYLRLTEERSMDLAEFIRGHVTYYCAQGESLEDIFRHEEVLRRVITGFGTLPELREVDIYLGGQRATFRYEPNWEIHEEIVTVGAQAPSPPAPDRAGNFQMVRLPFGGGPGLSDGVEFLGTMDFINEYIGKYLIMIYSLFTVVVGLATGVVGIIVNDTDRRLRQQFAELKDTQQQLAQAAKLASIGELAGGMAHEINTPITSILSLASHLAGKNDGELEPRQRNSLQLIAQQAERVSRIVSNLLTFARHSHLEVSRVDVGELLEAAAQLSEFRLRDGAIRLQRDIQANLPPVLGDAGRLTEVFVNLLNNAIDAMPQGGLLTLRACSVPAPDGGVRVEVTDTGCGIPPAELPRIFDPFFTTKQPGQGTGLGLSISHGIIQDHGGQIWAESQPGVYTTLCVTLPAGGSST